MSTEPMELVADDDIDTETLQAQIDMSMSFAHNLVSSWIKPVHKAKLSSTTVDAQKMLEEQLRRPPRLGVGAPIPETTIVVREAARLKHQLVGKGKKRAREDEDAAEKLSADSDGDEDSKGGVIKKKTKLDPFASGVGKKKKKNRDAAILETGLLTPQLTPQPNSIASQTMPLSQESKLEAVESKRVSINAVSANPPLIPADSNLSPFTKAKKKKRKKSNSSVGHSAPGPSSPASASYPLLPTPTPSHLGKASTPQSPDHNAAGSSRGPFAGPPAYPTHAITEVHKPSHTVDSLAISASRLQPNSPKAGALLLSLPLLNLDGPPADQPIQAGDGDGPSSPKKKRRKRKKKNLGNVRAGNS
ncbi:hypothetical protein BV22DRAFT_1124142 [Leucogyrophana mollusca]|uniref:Uncharacterized protein n=1 Tax=Leucogyrophana mollusca TaxID=85980 RepID=A0ACB8BYY5_9AGAM|nr:hypothetical protein BV22DRAFT_1124142 [Leucogyrophana mollusca]